LNTLSSSELKSVRQNIFPAAHGELTRTDFPWHRDRSGRVTAGRVHSSQALALDLLGTIKALREPSSRLLKNPG
jgi:hypothetical protein